MDNIRNLKQPAYEVKNGQVYNKVVVVSAKFFLDAEGYKTEKVRNNDQNGEKDGPYNSVDIHRMRCVHLNWGLCHLLCQFYEIILEENG